MTRTIKVGDIVFCSAGFGWFDGDERWVWNPKVRRKRHRDGRNCFNTCCTMKFYYVVTAIDEKCNDWSEGGELHPNYHVVTLAMTGEKGHRQGYTCADHYPPELVLRPKKYLLETGKAVIGERSGFLL